MWELDLLPSSGEGHLLSWVREVELIAIAGPQVVIHPLKLDLVLRISDGGQSPGNQ
jgi:hypothetical protein